MLLRSWLGLEFFEISVSWKVSLYKSSSKSASFSSIYEFDFSIKLVPKTEFTISKDV